MTRFLRWAAVSLAVTALVPASSRSEDAAVRARTDAMRPTASAASPAPVVSKTALGLSEAVQLTMAHDPRIQRARQDVAIALGQERQAHGAFDPLLFVEPSFSSTKQELFPFLAGLESQKRQVLRDLSAVFTDSADRLRQQLEFFDLTSPVCPDTEDILDIGDFDPFEREERARQTGLLPENIVIDFGDIGDDLGESLELCTDSETGFRFDTFLESMGLVDDTPEFDLSSLLTETEQLQRERIALTQNVFELVGTRTALAVARLGETPRDEETKGYAIDASYLKPMRNGMRWSVDGRFESSERNYIDKPLDPAFGGFGLPNQFPSFFSTSLDVPFGRGGSRRAVQATERAAASNIEARREILRHLVASEVVTTILAWNDLAAAQEIAGILAESAERQKRVVDVTRQLIEGGDVADVDLARAQARFATIEGARSGAERDVVAARVALAEAIGLGAGAMGEAPLAAEPLSGDLAPAPPIPDLVARALAERRDYRALDHQQEANEALAIAARSDLSWRIDFFVTAGMSTLYESPLFRYLPDEREVPPRDSAVHYDRPAGFWRSVTGSWDPFVTVGLRMDFPFHNNAAKGRFARERAALLQTQIRYVDTERVIRDNVVRAAVALDRARETVARRREAIENLERTLESTLALFDQGEIDLIDTLTTEENLTSERLALVRSLQLYHGLLARLRFDTGSVIDFDDEGTAEETARFDPVPFG
jgi:outer membrane protein TolC